MKRFFDYIGYTLLAIFLFGTHAKLFYWLQPAFSNEIYQQFSWQVFNEQTIQAAISGLLFGLMTVYIIARKQANPLYRIFVIAIAIFDGLVVFYLNEGDLDASYKMLFASIHYSLYTMFIILMFGYPDKKIAIEKLVKLPARKIARKKIVSNIDSEILALKDSGMKGTAIAKKLNISESKVSRTKYGSNNKIRNI